jgi:hypothetical protein
MMNHLHIHARTCDSRKGRYNLLGTAEYCAVTSIATHRSTRTLIVQQYARVSDFEFAVEATLQFQDRLVPSHLLFVPIENQFPFGILKLQRGARSKHRTSPFVSSHSSKDSKVSKNIVERFNFPSTVESFD